MMEKDVEGVKSIGCQNGWTQHTPEEFIKHEESVAKGEKHNVEAIRLGNCYYQVICHTCKISWTIDSGD